MNDDHDDTPDKGSEKSKKPTGPTLPSNAMNIPVVRDYIAPSENRRDRERDR